ncbi:hypothetical protein [Methylomicrobium album]|uniref:Lipoprotein n=1 Tax=Methylomicrobium album BG8 TaxID=686340 RepID=H8GJH8_METAL|nr:hypothetical protein [Methylomicrobium album]EIC30338.1 hypothetical protein Metal_2625 [Methylomicrobium album BG8]
MNQSIRTLAFLGALSALGGCVATSPSNPATPVSMQPITYFVPSDDGLIRQTGMIEDLSFSDFSYYSTGRRDKLFAKRIGNNSLAIERRTETESGIAGSGKRYQVDFAVEKTDSGYKAVIRPVEYSTYQQGVILPFPVPKFDEADLTENLLSTQLYYRFEVNSEFNSESTHANFMRILKTRPFQKGEKDPVTGKIFTQQFVLPYRTKEVLFTLETFPYRNGSKAVMHLRVPAMLTSPNVIDYKVILDEVKAKLAEIVRA